MMKECKDAIGFQGKAGSEASLCIGEGVSPTLRPAIEADVVYCFEPGILSRDCSAGNRAYRDICSTLRAQMGDNQPAVCYTMNERQISMMIRENQANTIAATDYKGVQILCYEENNGKD